jgi:hypothetical protein
MTTDTIHLDPPSIGINTNERSLLSVLIAFNEGEFSQAVDQFDERFIFSDNARGLEFTDKERLIKFFQKSCELFPDSVVEVESTFCCGDHTIAKWKLTATQTRSYGGYLDGRVRISVRGVSIAHFKNERIVKWSDYYDATVSWRSRSWISQPSGHSDLM